MVASLEVVFILIVVAKLVVVFKVVVIIKSEVDELLIIVVSVDKPVVLIGFDVV